MELGASALSDKYDQAGDNGLNIYALDATVDGKSVGFLPDALELLGEAAWDNIERDDFAVASGVPNDFNGYYVQANYRFDPEWLRALESDGTVDQGARPDLRHALRSRASRHLRPPPHHLRPQLPAQRAPHRVQAGLPDQQRLRLARGRERRGSAAVLGGDLLLRA
jgi:hypothetical protein